MAEIDDTLRSALSRIARDADNSGVADAIRARVAAGDSGTPAPSSGFRAGLPGWLPFLGLLVVAAVIGGGLGLSGIFGTSAPLSLLTSSHAVTEGTSLYNCPGGVVVGYASRGERILAIARSSDDRYVGIRNPGSPADTVWLPTGEITSDQGQPALSTLMVGGCPSVTVETTQAPVAVAPVAPVAPAPPTKPAPPAPKDTTPPALNLGKPNPSQIFGNAAPNPCAKVVTLVTTASDAGGVKSTTAASSFPGTIIHQSGSATATTFTFSMPYSGNSPDVTVTVTVTSTDGAGNQTSQQQFFTLTSSSSCLI